MTSGVKADSKKIAEVIASYALTNSYNATAKQCGISDKSVKKIIENNPKEYEKKKEAFSDYCNRLIYKALDKLDKEEKGLYIYNLGTGTGYSVLDTVKAFEKANNVKVPYKIAPRRPGDIAKCYADPTKAKNELGFVAHKNLEDMCKDSWNFQKNCNL